MYSLSLRATPDTPPSMTIPSPPLRVGPRTGALGSISGIATEEKK